MMGCSEGSSGGELSMHDSLLKPKPTKLRPLVPKPTTTLSTLPTLTSPLHTCTLTTNLLPSNHLLSNETQQNRKNFSGQALGSSRWNPTAEQLLALEEMYRCGTRTPTADQIQQIAFELRRFGKIEGKNVFYWFQNHKARERQKRRRQMETTHSEHQQLHMESLDKKELGLRRTGNEVEETKKWVPCSNCSRVSEEFVLMNRLATAESRTDGWTQFEEKELQQRRMSRGERHAMWQTMEVMSCSPPTHPIMKNSNTTITTSLCGNLFDDTDQSFTSLLKPNPENITNNIVEDESRETQTLELFPLHSDDDATISGSKKEEIRSMPIKTMNTNFNPNHFFEFLPLKN